MESNQEKMLRFVTTDKLKEKYLLRASEACKEYELEIEWISANDLKNQDMRDQRSVFVLERFEGEAFEFLKENGCQIVGPQCVLSCLQTQTSLPINLEHPVYSVAMRGMAITCTSVPRQERDRLSELIEFMGGTVLKDLTSSVTHLVAGEVGSKKYRVACSLDQPMPILLPEWVYTCWDMCHDRHICATDDEFMEFKCPIFKGITLCVTGIDAEKRKEIKHLVTFHGGTYSGELNMNTCTHLLVETPRGEKYEYARKWNLHCVSTQWFFDSVEDGFCLDESPYYILPDEDNCSTAGRRLSGKLVKGITASSKSSAAKKSSNKAAEAALKSAQRHGNEDLMLTSGNKKSLSNQSKRFNNVSRLAETHLGDAESSDFDVQMQPGNLFLDGCKIYLSGFSGEKLEKLRKIINCGGGTRFNQINEIVSHVIIGNKVDAELESLCSCDFQGFVVDVQWILNSAREGQKLPEEEYLYSDLINPQGVSPSCKENKDPAVKPLKTPANTLPPPQNLSTGKIDTKITMQGEDFFEDGDDDDDVFQQYMPLYNNVENNTTSARIPQVTENGDQVKDLDRPTADPDATLDEDEEPEQNEDGLLSGRCFTVAGFADVHVERLKQMIESNGGKYAVDTQIADYAIFPMDMVPDSGTKAKEFATFCWLEQSLQCDQLLQLNKNFLFKPFSIPNGEKPLRGCVISISKFSGMEREHMYQLAELLGACCQEYFVRKASQNYEASTHLVCQDPNGSKYKAALKWNIPVVSGEWLFACAASGTLAPIDDYPLVEGISVTECRSDACPSDCLDDDKTTSFGEDAKTDNVGVVQEEVCMETSDASAEPLASLTKTEGQSVVSGDPLPGDSVSGQTRPMKRPSIYNRPFRPSFDLAEVMDELASPACPSIRGRKSRASRNSFPLDDFFAENIKQTLQKLGTVAPPSKDGKNGYDNGDGKANGECPEREEMVAFPKQGILVGIVLSVSKKLSQQQTELFSLASSLGADYRWLYDESCTHLIHQGSSNDKTKEYTQARDRGIHIVSPHWLYTCKEKNERVDESLFPHTFNPKLSIPVMTTGRRLTRSSKSVPVEQETSPQKKSKSPTVKKSEPDNSEQPKQTSNALDEQSKPVAEGKQGASEDTAEGHDSETGAASVESLEAREDIMRQLEAIMDATKGKGRRRSRRNTSSNNSSNASHNASASGTSGDVSLATRRTSSRLRLRTKDSGSVGNKSSSRVKSRFPATDESEHSQSDTITYDDPAGRMERDRIIAQLKRGASPSPDCNTEEEEEEKKRHGTTPHKNERVNDKDSIAAEKIVEHENIEVERHVRQLSATIRSEPPSPISSSTPAAPPIGLQIKDTLKPQPVNLLDGTALAQTQPRGPTTPKFHLSVMTPQEKIDYSALIEQLGGQVFDTVYFNPECTHVVVGKPNRNEKYLAAVAAGKWVLHKSYLEASREAGFFVDEASHEWGLEIPGEPYNKLAAAAQRWRLKLIEERALSAANGRGAHICGAFNGWIVLLCVDKSRQPGFKRLLEAGGAKVSASRPPFKNTDEFTHAFLDLPKTKVDVSELSLLQRDGVWCLKPDYIAEYLMQDPPPRPQKYQVPELSAQSETNKPVSSQSRKRKGDHDLTNCDKKQRV